MNVNIETLLTGIKNWANSKLSAKQDKLTAGANITIDANNVISADVEAGGCPVLHFTLTEDEGQTSFVISQTEVQKNANEPIFAKIKEEAIEYALIKLGDLYVPTTAIITNGDEIQIKMSGTENMEFLTVGEIDINADNDVTNGYLKADTVQHKLTAGTGISISANNVISAEIDAASNILYFDMEDDGDEKIFSQSESQKTHNAPIFARLRDGENVHLTMQAQNEGLEFSLPLLPALTGDNIKFTFASYVGGVEVYVGTIEIEADDSVYDSEWKMLNQQERLTAGDNIEIVDNKISAVVCPSLEYNIDQDTMQISQTVEQKTANTKVYTGIRDGKYDHVHIHLAGIANFESFAVVVADGSISISAGVANLNRNMLVEVGIDSDNDLVASQSRMSVWKVQQKLVAGENIGMLEKADGTTEIFATSGGAACPVVEYWLDPQDSTRLIQTAEQQVKNAQVYDQIRLTVPEHMHIVLSDIGMRIMADNIYYDSTSNLISFSGSVLENTDVYQIYATVTGTNLLSSSSYAEVHLQQMLEAGDHITLEDTDYGTTKISVTGIDTSLAVLTYNVTPQERTGAYDLVQTLAQKTANAVTYELIRSGACKEVQIKVPDVYIDEYVLSTRDIYTPGDGRIQIKLGRTMNLREDFIEVFVDTDDELQNGSQMVISSTSLALEEGANIVLEETDHGTIKISASGGLSPYTPGAGIKIQDGVISAALAAGDNISLENQADGTVKISADTNCPTLEYGMEPDPDDQDIFNITQSAEQKAKNALVYAKIRESAPDHVHITVGEVFHFTADEFGVTEDDFIEITSGTVQGIASMTLNLIINNTDNVEDGGSIAIFNCAKDFEVGTGLVTTIPDVGPRIISAEFDATDLTVENVVNFLNA